MQCFWLIVLDSHLCTSVFYGQLSHMDILKTGFQDNSTSNGR